MQRIGIDWWQLLVVVNVDCYGSVVKCLTFI